MRNNETNKNHNLIFLGGFAVFWIFMMLIMAGLGKGWNACENKMLQGSLFSWWHGDASSSQQPAGTIEVLSTKSNEELLDSNELMPSNTFFPPMYHESSYEGSKEKWYNSIDTKPMKAIRFGRERDASGVQNDVHIIAMPGYFFK
ncbi:MAG: hypothetical protein ABH886_00765 [Candidatus Desantisbacteria bacterium]